MPSVTQSDVAAAPTPAQIYLAERQRAYPPCYPHRNGLDRARQLCRTLEAGLPEALRTRLAEGSVVVGEVGLFDPDVRTLPTDKGFAIEFSTGMMDYDYAIGRALAGIHVEHTQAGPQNAMAQPLSNVVELVAAAYRQWKWHSRWSWLRQKLILRPVKRIRHAEFEVAPGPRQWIDNLVTTAEAYQLAHEFGHVALDLELVPPVKSNDEENADFYGLQFFLAAFESKGSQRFCYAAPIFAIRLFAGLERLPGVAFSAAYPPTARRIELLREQILARHPSLQYFREAATIMVAYQDMMDDIDEYIFKKTSAVSTNAERVLIRLIAQLEEVARGRVTQDKFIEDFAKIAEHTSPAVLKEAATTLQEYYLPPSGNECFLSADLRLRMAVALASFVTALPPHLHTFFSQTPLPPAFSQTPLPPAPPPTPPSLGA